MSMACDRPRRFLPDPIHQACQQDELPHDDAR